LAVPLLLALARTTTPLRRGRVGTICSHRDDQQPP
jgi:hypothetical protein